jgi:tetratricopeptide (TPR) repeat protein
MKRSFVLWILISLVSFTFAQKKKKGEKDAPKQEQAPVQQPVVQSAPVKQTPKDSIPKVNTFVQHYAMKYATAVQWSDYDVAKDALYDLIVLNPGNDSLIYDLAIFYYQNQKYPSAVMVSQELLKRNPKNTGALEIAAVGYENLGVSDKALQSYESLYLLNNNSATLYKMAFLQYRLKRYKESNTSADILLASKEAEALKITYNDASNKPKEYAMKVALLNLKGMVAQDQGDKVNAKKFYDQALAIAPDFGLAKDNLSKLK